MKKTLVMLVVGMLVLGLIPMTLIPPAAAGVNGDIYVEPSRIIYDTTNGSICTSFNITVKVRNIAVQTFGWQVRVYFHTCYINVTRWYEPTWDPSYVFYGFATLAVPTPPAVSYVEHEPGIDSATVSSAYFPPLPPTGFTGNGILCIMKFHICSVPGKSEVFTSDLAIDNDFTYLLDSTGAVIPDINKINGYYEMDWVAPPRPTLTVSPTYLEPNDALGGYALNLTVPPYKFNVTVLISSLDVAWGLTNATFCLCYNTTLINVTRWWIDPLWQNSLVTYTVTPTWDELNVTVWNPTGTPSGNVKLVIIEFKILYQGESPPRPVPPAPGSWDESPLNICGSKLMDHTAEILTNPPVQGRIRIYARMALPLPYFEVVPKDTVYGPEPSVSKVFAVDVVIRNLHQAWYLVGYQLRLTYDDSLLEGVDIACGPFLYDPRWNLYGVLNITDWRSDGYGPNAIVAAILWPNANNVYDQTIFPTSPGAGPPPVPDLDPPVNPVVATIRFHIVKQPIAWPPINLTCDLAIKDYDGGHYGIDKDGEYVPFGIHKDGKYTIISTPATGRVIDVYGGVECTAFPVPFGGQGLNEPMDMVWPQKEVCLFANVTYNFWPVQNKIVSFEVEGPFDVRVSNISNVDLAYPLYSNWTLIWPYPDKYQIISWHDNGDGVLGECDNIDTVNLKTGDIEWWHVEWIQWDGSTIYMQIRYKVYPPTGGAWFLYKDTAITDEFGVARLSFRMPWQCFDAEKYFGIYRVTATVDIACEVVIDRTYFHYDYLVRIFKVTTERFYYKHCEEVKICVTYGTHAMQVYPAVFFISIKDELDVPIGKYELGPIEVGGAYFCKYKTTTFCARIHIPKWAFAGYAYLHVNCFNKNPTQGGFAWCPEYTQPPHCPQTNKPYPTIYIQPY